MKVNVWEHQGYDIAAVADNDRFNLFCIKDNIIDFVRTEPVKIGSDLFIPGKTYTSFGKEEKSSAGYISYRGEPITYYGHYDGYLLFTKENQSPAADKEGYRYIFFAWRMLKSVECLFTLNYQGAGRIMEM